MYQPMADLNSRQWRKLEQLFEMGSGYVLNFSNRTFAEFFEEFVGKDIYGGRYSDLGTSKANHLRSFWEKESDFTVAKCIVELIAHGRDADLFRDCDVALIRECEDTAARLTQGKTVADIDAIRADDADPDFELVAKAAVECIEKNVPQEGLDRLHTFAIKFGSSPK